MDSGINKLREEYLGLIVQYYYALIKCRDCAILILRLVSFSVVVLAVHIPILFSNLHEVNIIY